jgi:hypothetical protein
MSSVPKAEAWACTRCGAPTRSLLRLCDGCFWRGPVAVPKKVDAEVVQIRPEDRQTAPEVMTLQDIRGLPEPEWLVSELIPADGQLIALSGFSNTGKTLMALDIALSIAAGVPWFERAVRPGRAVYIPLEGLRAIPPRIDAWLAHHEQGDEAISDRFNVIRFPNGLHLDTPSSVVWLRDWLAEQPGMFVVLDTFGHALGNVSENDASEMRVILNGLRELVESTHTTIMLIQHTGWNKHRERGSTAARGEMDAVLHLELEDDKDETKTGRWLRNPKQRAWETQASVFCRIVPVPGSQSVVLQPDRPEAELKADTLLTEVTLLVREAGADGISTPDAGAALRKRGMTFKDNALRETVAEAIERGYIIRQGRGPATRLYPPPAESRPRKRRLSSSNSESRPSSADH